MTNYLYRRMQEKLSVVPELTNLSETPQLTDDEKKPNINMKLQGNQSTAFKTSDDNLDNQARMQTTNDGTAEETHNQKQLAKNDKAEKKDIIFRIGTGNIQQVFKWFGQLDGIRLFEIAAQFVAYYDQCKEDSKQIILILRERMPPNATIRVKYYKYKFPVLPPLIPGTLLRCIGNMTDQDTMRAVKINIISNEQAAHLERISHVCKVAFR